MKVAMADLGDVALCYETRGDARNPAIVLIRGLGTQLIEWPSTLLNGLVREGLRVVVFDNRDAGLSTAMTTATGEPPYRLEDMANDVVGLLDDLRIERAHIFGISLGGMIAQHVALEHRDRVRSLISVMSTTGNPDLPMPSAEMRARLVETAATPDALIALNAQNRAAFGSPAYPETLSERLAAARSAYQRSHRPDGVARQMQAAIADGSRVDRLRALSVPTLVIHGADDPLIPVAAGRDTAVAIRGARLEVIAGMGHNIPDALAPRIVALVGAFVRGVSG
jgi:pimeloyl-ACP methyl ester carboxylesterase